MNTESRPYAERKFLVVVREPGLLEQVVDFGTWVVVPIVKIGWEAYEKIKQRGLPALIQVTASDVTSLVFPPGHPEINTIYTAHPMADSPRYYVTATFHQRLFEERVAEFARVMRCAGAMKLTIDAERKTGRDADGMVKLRAGIAASILNFVCSRPARQNSPSRSVAVTASRLSYRPTCCSSNMSQHGGMLMTQP
jgi:hypothetical protein